VIEKEEFMKVMKVKEIPGIVPPAHYDLISHRILNASDKIGNIVVAWVCMETSGKTDLHSHENTEHLFIVMKGELGVKTNNGDVCVRPGEAVLISSGELHGNFNASKGETEYIVVNYTLTR
jgi:mannose-6-phosphate isomerase-like protein (cupin superfamily)